MAWDFLRDGGTGDWVFAGNRDLMGVSGDELTKQRITVRTKIPRGEFVYDKDKTLGSRLYEAMRYPIQRTLSEAPTILSEALEPMLDISVTRVEPEIDEMGRSILLKVFYVYVVLPGEPITEVNQQESSTEITIPLSIGNLGVSIGE